MGNKVIFIGVNDDVGAIKNISMFVDHILGEKGYLVRIRLVFLGGVDIE